MKMEIYEVRSLAWSIVWKPLMLSNQLFERFFRPLLHATSSLISDISWECRCSASCMRRMRTSDSKNQRKRTYANKTSGGIEIFIAKGSSSCHLSRFRVPDRYLTVREDAVLESGPPWVLHAAELASLSWFRCSFRKLSCLSSKSARIKLLIAV